MNKPTTLMCPFFAGFECHWVGEALPPDGSRTERSASNRCPPGYLPHCRHPAVALVGKRVLTGQPAERQPDASTDASTDATGEPPAASQD